MMSRIFLVHRERNRASVDRTLGIDRPVEQDPAAEVLLELRGLHARAKGLQRVHPVQAGLYHRRQERPKTAAGSAA
jgi:hypothetical protein